MANFSRTMSNAGRIKVDANANDGTGLITVAVGQANTQYSLTFCPFRAPCFDVAQFTSSGMSEVSGTFAFPQRGTWSGVFVLTSADGNRTFISGFIGGINTNLPPSVAHFVKAESVTGGVSGFQTGNDPLGSGTISIDGNANVTVQLSGVAPNASYSLIQCVVAPASQSGTCIPSLATLMTDGSGDGSLTDAARSPAIWVLTRNGAAQFVSGFVVQ